jgi:hypothetical protein
MEMPLSRLQGIGVALVAIATIGTVVFVTSRNGSTPTGTAAQSPPRLGTPTATFVAPTEGAEVTQTGFPAKGTTSGLQPSDMLWLVTVANPRLGSDTYQPQDVPCPRTTDGGFDCRMVYVGGPADGGRTYDVLLLLVSPSAAQVFRAYNESNPASNGWPGLPALPDGTEVIGSVRVTRR